MVSNNYSISIYQNISNAPMSEVELQGKLNLISSRGDKASRISIISEIFSVVMARKILIELLNYYSQDPHLQKALNVKKIVVLSILIGVGIYLSRVYRKCELFFLKYAKYLQQKKERIFSNEMKITFDGSQPVLQGDPHVFFGLFSRGFRIWENTEVKTFERKSRQAQEKELKEELQKASWLAKKTLLQACFPSFAGKGYRLG